MGPSAFPGLSPLGLGLLSQLLAREGPIASSVTLTPDVIALASCLWDVGEHGVGRDYSPTSRGFRQLCPGG